MEEFNLHLTGDNPRDHYSEQSSPHCSDRCSIMFPSHPHLYAGLFNRLLPLINGQWSTAFSPIQQASWKEWKVEKTDLRQQSPGNGWSRPTADPCVTFFPEDHRSLAPSWDWFVRQITIGPSATEKTYITRQTSFDISLRRPVRWHLFSLWPLLSLILANVDRWQWFASLVCRCSLVKPTLMPTLSMAVPPFLPDHESTSNWSEQNDTSVTVWSSSSSFISLICRWGWRWRRTFHAASMWSISIYKEESLSVCLFVCLFFMHLDTVRASAAKLSRNTLLNQEKVESYFFSKNYKSFPPKTNPSISNQWDCSIPWYRRSTLQDFKITQRTSHHRFSRAVSPNLGSIWVKSYWLTSNQ